jgi:hypothetical protein
MENAKTFFDTWVENQSKVVKEWTEAGQKFQKEMTGGSAVEKGTEIYNDWLKKQNEMFSSFTNGSKNGNSTQEHTNTSNPAEVYKTWYEGQMNAAKTWMDLVQENIGKFGQNEQTEKIKSSVKEGSEKWMSSMNTWNEAVLSSYNNVSKNFSNPISADAFTNVFKNTEVYQKMYELWNATFKNFQGGSFKPETFWTSYNADAYKQVIDKMFGFNAASYMRDLFGKSSESMKKFHDELQSNSKKFWNTLQGESSLFGGLLNTDQQVFVELYKKFFNNLKNSTSPFFKLAEDGKDKENAELMINLIDKYALYLMKSSELQYMMYTSGVQAMEKVGQDVSARMQEKKEFNSFQEFYTEWVGSNEKIYTELFKTDSFSKLQGELLGIDLEIKKDVETQVQNILKPFPIALRKDLDEVYEANYELTNRVRSLEKRIKELEKLATATPAANTPSIATTSAKTSNVVSAGQANTTATAVNSSNTVNKVAGKTSFPEASTPAAASKPNTASTANKAKK